MTIDDFKKKVAPHMNKGWVAMDRDSLYWWYRIKPIKSKVYWSITTGEENDVCFLGKIYNIEPVEDWTKSLINVGQ